MDLREAQKLVAQRQAELKEAEAKLSELLQHEEPDFVKALDSYLRDRAIPKGESDALFFEGKVLEDDFMYTFSITPFHEHLMKCGSTETVNALVVKLKAAGAVQRGNTEIVGKQTRPWVMSKHRHVN